MCGDGSLQSSNGEQCDDGNLSNGDGCSSSCLIETGWACTSSSVSNKCMHKECGNGALNTSAGQ